jgi:hypothetical protein
LLVGCVGIARAQSPAPGTLIDQGNLDLYSPYLPAALKFAIAHGLKARVRPTVRIDWPTGFQQATEQYSGQVSLNEQPVSLNEHGVFWNYVHGVVQNYVAGLPFPLIKPNDPKAGIEVAYNWRWGPFVPDYVSLPTAQRFLAWTTDYRSSELTNDDKDRDYRGEGPCNELVFLRHSHRTKVDPRPTLGADSEVDWKVHGTHCGGARDVGETWTERYGSNGIGLDVFVPVSSIWSLPWGLGWALPRTFGDFPSRGCTYSCTSVWWEYVAPLTELYGWRLAGQRPLLACLDAPRESAVIARLGDTAHFDEVPVQLRSAYVLEAQPPEHVQLSFWGLGASITPLRATIYIDSESYVLLGAEFQWFDLVDASVPLWGRQAAAIGGEQLILSNEFFVPGDRAEFFLSLNIPPGVQKVNMGRTSVDQDSSP